MFLHLKSTEHLAADCKQIAMMVCRFQGRDFKLEVMLFNEEHKAVLEKAAEHLGFEIYSDSMVIG